jgi:hypothetical protein
MGMHQDRAAKMEFGNKGSEAASECAGQKLMTATTKRLELDPDLSRHYEAHNVKGMPEFVASLTHKGTSTTSSLSNGLSRFVRLNPRFDVEETLNMLKVRTLL